MERQPMTKNAKFLLPLLLAGCVGLKGLPESNLDQSPRLKGGLTGTESIFDAKNDTATASGNRAATQASSVVPTNYRDLKATTPTYLPPLLSSRADTLPNRAVVYWVADSQLPIASIRFYWKEGTLGLSPVQAAQAQMLGGMLRQGGVKGMSPQAVDDTLEDLAAEISIGFGAVRTEASVEGFSRDIPYLLDLFSRMLREPTLDTTQLSIAKAETFQAIEHRLDAPAQVLDAAWSQVSYGPSAWTRRADTNQIKTVTPEILRGLLQGRLDPSRLVIAVAGRFDKTALRQKLSNLFPTAPVPAPGLDVLPTLPQSHERGVWIAPVEATQAFVKIGTRFVRRDHPDYYPLMLACQVLGSGFGTRLVDRIRSDEGLAYHVGAFAGSDYDREAVLGVDLQTKSVSAHRAIQLVFEEVVRLRENGFLPGELDKARKALKASLPTLFESPEATAELFGLSASWARKDDHFRTYQKALDSIPEARVLEVFRRYFEPADLRIVVAGPKEELLAAPKDGSRPLQSYGPVHILAREELLRGDAK
jgi:zinc protease